MSLNKPILSLVKAIVTQIVKKFSTFYESVRIWCLVCRVHNVYRVQNVYRVHNVYRVRNVYRVHNVYRVQMYIVFTMYIVFKCISCSQQLLFGLSLESLKS